MIHQRFFSDEADPPLPYTTDAAAADKIRARLKAIYGYRIETGQTRTRPRRHFARFESGPSTSTETLAETLPLAISRLALVIAAKRDPSAH